MSEPNTELKIPEDLKGLYIDAGPAVGDDPLVIDLIERIARLEASHAELMKELEDHMWQPPQPASPFLICRGCASPQGKEHHKVCCINNALQKARMVME